MNFAHGKLANGRWHELTLMEQMGNIGSEVLRVARREGGDKQFYWAAVERALELFDLTLSDARWIGRLREIARAREVFCDAVYGGKLYGSSYNGLMRYFDQFALSARKELYN